MSTKNYSKMTKQQLITELEKRAHDTIYTDVVTVRQYVYWGIAILVQIDRDKGKISLVEQRPDGSYKPKSWKFAERTVNYMNGWRAILKAMDRAVTDAQADLEAYQAAQERKKTDSMIAMHLSLKDMKAPK